MRARLGQKIISLMMSALAYLSRATSKESLARSPRIKKSWSALREEIIFFIEDTAGSPHSFCNASKSF